MAYTSFKTLAQIEKTFAIGHKVIVLFDKITPLQPSDWLKKTLIINMKTPLRSEKSRSEMVVAPVITEIRERNDNSFMIFSGENLDADAKQGLKGECDFIIINAQDVIEIEAPIVQIVEAKKQDFDIGIPQCAAQMIGAKIFNDKRNKNIPIIYGCVTTGKEWRFLRLEKDIIYIDNQSYYLENLPELLGVFQVIIDEFKPIID
jgi:glycerophosphoryl diester phosphodiesterase